MRRKIWNLLGTPQSTNIISVITLIITTLVSIIAIVVSRSSQNQSPNQSSGFNGFLIGILLFVIVITFINIFYLYKTKNKYNVIRALIELQNKYILEPDFKTSKEHGEQSRETELQEDGDAKILTNSLNYDMHFCKQIADNITKGAKYTYILPTDSNTLIGLSNYIEKLYTEVNKIFSISNNANKATEKAIKILKENLTFWFFDNDILCLYNFARFNQRGDDNFEQSWWYVNPKDHNDDSPMLSKEIKDNSDQKKLMNTFEELRKISKIKNGYDININREDLHVFLGGK